MMDEQSEHTKSAGWAHLWASRALLFFGAALGLAGVIYFFAFNWDDLPDLAKLGIVQVGFVGCLAGAGLRGLDRLTSRVLVVSAATLLGVFLAVFGQIYQTGADPWQLFALWSALALPLILLAKSQGGWVLQGVITTLAVVLFMEQRLYLGDHHSLAEHLFPGAVSAVGGLLWFGLEYWRERRAPNWLEPFWSRTVFAIAVFGGLALPSMVLVEDPARQVLQLALLGCATAVVWFRYVRTEFDMGVVGIAAVSWLLTVLARAIDFVDHLHIDGAGVFLLLGIFTLGASAAVVKALRALQERYQSTDGTWAEISERARAGAERVLDGAAGEESAEPPKAGAQEESESRLLTVVAGIGAWVAALFFIGFLAAADILALGEPIVILLAVMIAATAIWLDQSFDELGVFGRQGILAASFVAQVIAIVSIVEFEQVVQMALTVLFSGVLYAAIATRANRIFSSAIAAGALAVHASIMSGEVGFYVVFALVLAMPCAVFGGRQWMPSPVAKSLRPAAYSTAVLALMMASHWTTEIYDGSTEFGAKIILAVAAASLLTTAASEVSDEDMLDNRFLASVVAIVLLGLVSSPGILCAVLLVGLGLWRHRTPLAILGALGLAVHLVTYYYHLDTTLLVKSGVLVGSGLILLVLRWLVDRGAQHVEETS